MVVVVQAAPLISITSDPNPQHTPLPVENAKLTAAPTHRGAALSELRLYTRIDISQRAFSHCRQAEQNAREIGHDQALRMGIGADGADVPMDQVDGVGWCISQLEECGEKAETNDKVAPTHGGKVLVVDIELTVEPQ
jgi:hypothetical protein